MDNYIKIIPDELNDINIDDITKKILNICINNNKIKFLITGNLSCGKTSLIDIILNKYYKDINEKNNNILYFNLLKEPGINYYRNDLKNYCQQYNYIKNNKKIIIFDDIDILNDSVQQIFNTLIDKYDNINFILSCSDINKIHSNLKNKLEIIKINNTTDDFLLKLCKKILVNKNYILNNNFLIENIIKYSNKNIPNLVNNLYILMLTNNIDNLNIENLDKCINLIQYCKIEKYFSLCENKDYINSIEHILSFYKDGYSVIDILSELILYIKNISILNDEIKYKLIKIITNYICIFNNTHEDSIELVFMTSDIIHIFNL
tara:strand:+ start:393 stop:1349 length:957 start_codon:yes stop_codon:yes gene_type:complete